MTELQCKGSNMPEPPLILPKRLYRQDWGDRADGPTVVWIHAEESLATAYVQKDGTQADELPSDNSVKKRTVLPMNHPMNLRGAMRCMEDDIARKPFTGAPNA